MIKLMQRRSDASKNNKTEAEYDQALHRIDALMDALPNTEDGSELELLVTLVEFY